MKARLVSVLASMTLAAALAVMAAPAQADPVPTEQQFYASDQGFGQDYANDHVISMAWLVFSAPNGLVPTASYTDVTWSSCGQVVQTRRHYLTEAPNGSASMLTHHFSADGQPANMEVQNEINRKIGNTFEWTATIVHPGYDPYVRSGTMTARYPRPSCEEILSGDDIEQPTVITVSKWSTKKGAKTAYIGKRLAVTPTRAPGAQVSYAWRVGTKVVDRDRSLTVKKSYRGKKVALRITALNRPGSDGGSGYWIPTRDWSVRFVA